MIHSGISSPHSSLHNVGYGSLTWSPRTVGRAFVTANTVSSCQDRDSAEAAGFGNWRTHIATRAVRVCAAPWSWIQGLYVTFSAALATGRASIQQVSVASTG